MFTGLIRDIGLIHQLEHRSAGVRFLIESQQLAPTLALGESIAVNGVCLTVLNVADARFTVEAVEETLRKTTLGKLRSGMRVNLEPALKMSDPLGGHFVLGHVDAVGTILSIERELLDRCVKISYPQEFDHYLVPEGSVAVDGISLTVASIEEHEFTVAIIPHTWEKTNISDRRVGDSVNIEFDVLGKYVVRMLEPGMRATSLQSGGKGMSHSLSEEDLRQLGFT